MTPAETADAPRTFTEADELRWHQLDLLRRILPPSDGPSAPKRPQGRAGAARQQVEAEPGCKEVPAEWGLAADITLYPWQKAALEAWEKNGRSGVVKVVTGAGKTMLALTCLERWLREDDANLASIVVPTRVLLDQWFGELTEKLRLPAAWIGRRSSDYKDSFGDGRRVMIYVLNSARTALGRPLPAEALRDSHFLVVDECHRAGSAENRKIFKLPRAACLGLSATPERDVEAVPDSDASGDHVPDPVLQELGSIIYELDFREALKEGIVPRFELIHVAVSLTGEERGTYDRLSRELRDVRSKLRRDPAFRRARSRVPNEFQLIRSLAQRGRSPVRKLAGRHETLISQRKELLYQARNRSECFEAILEEERRSQDIRVMAFHERISEVNRLYERLVRDGQAVVLDHTGLTESQRDRSLALYLRGMAPILLSVKALIEGVNAPATDVGVIVAASTSPRQKIQSMGRVMRRYRGKDASRIYNVYVADSTDERAFERLDFEKVLGVDRVEYRTWLGPGQWRQEDGPPRRPLPADFEIDESLLQVGEPYPAKTDGLRLSLDTQGNVSRPVADGSGGEAREIASFPAEVLDAIEAIRPGGGEIRVTERRHHVLVSCRGPGGEWQVLYAGRLPGAVQWRRVEHDRVRLKIGARFGGCIEVAKRGVRTFDANSSAAISILGMLHRFRGHGSAVHRVELDRRRDVFVHVGGEEHLLGRLGEHDGWPFGMKSLDDLHALGRRIAKQ